MNLRTPWLAAITATALLTACGGGGGDPAPPATSFNPGAAYRNLLTTSNTWTVTGVGSDAQSYQLRLTTTPTTPGTFPVTGASASRMTLFSEIRVNGQLAGNGSLTYYFNNTDASLVGIENDDGSCERSTANTALPTTAVAGQSGAIASINELNGCAPAAAAVGTATLGWSIETDGALTLFCLNSTSRDLAGAIIGTEADCVETSAAGVLGTKARVSVTLPAQNFSLVAKNY